MTLDDVETPALVLDEDRFDANAARAIRRATEQGVALRPHFKTLKSRALARRLVARGVDRFCVSTLREAEELAAAGVRDAFYAVALEPRKIPRVARLLAGGMRLTVQLDGLQGARACAAAAAAVGIVLDCFVEVDLDGHRSGVPADSPAFDELCAFVVGAPGLRLNGLASYGGASYDDSGIEAIAARAELHRAGLRRLRERLRSRGLADPVLSFGSTPAFLHASTLQGLDEVRSGILLFGDVFQAGIGTCGLDDLAVSVVTTVIGHDSRRGLAFVDAGALALSKDRSTAGRPFDCGYGLVGRLADARPIDDLQVVAVNQEIGFVGSRSGRALDPERFPVGTRFRILPNHADLTAAAHDRYWTTRANRREFEVADRFNYW